ncbi:MAG: glycosyltransferase [Oligoflexia bacterium]|nr:glycosyltransferase [Oligoflexia bacterium]
MKITHIGKYLPPVTGGIERVVYELCSALSQSNLANITCVCSNVENKTVEETKNNFKIYRLARLAVVASTPINPALKSTIKKLNPDLLHVHLPNPMATLAIKNLKIPYIVTYHCDIVRYPAALKLYKPQLDKFLKNAKKIIASSQELIESSEILKKFKNNCEVIPFGIDTSLFEINQNENLVQMHKEFGENIVLFVGRLVKYKNLNILIQSMKTVDGKLIIIGTGPELNKLKKLTTKLKLQNKVIFKGYIQDKFLPTYYKAAKLVALTSTNQSEAFGMCLIEALSNAKPLVTTKLNTGVSFVNQDGITGLHVPVGDISATANAINKLLNSPELYKKMSEAALSHFKNNFTLDKMVARHIQLYKDVLCK